MTEESFALEADQPAPVEKRCGTCALFAWSTGPTGRKRPTERGLCRFRIEWPEWPACFTTPYGCGRPVHPAPGRTFCFEGKNCHQWKGTK
jgi:hypothetical protein